MSVVKAVHNIKPRIETLKMHFEYIIAYIRLFSQICTHALYAKLWTL